MSEERQVILNPSHIELDSTVGLDLETSGLKAWESDIRLIIIDCSSRTYILDTTKYHPSFLKEVLQNVSLCERVVAHNAKFDCGFIYSHYGILLRNLFCTQIASQIITNGKLEFQGRHSLPEVIERYLGAKFEFSGKKKYLKGTKIKEYDVKKLLQKSFTQGFNLTETQYKYAAEDTKYLIPLYKLLSKKIDNLQMRTVGKLEMDLIPVLAKMEIEGCLVDQDTWRKLIYDVWEPELREIEKRLDSEVQKLDSSYGGRRVQEITQFDLFAAPRVTRQSDASAFNYGSQDQVIQLFRDLGEEVPYIEIDLKESKDDNISAYSIIGSIDLFDYTTGPENRPITEQDRSPSEPHSQSSYRSANTSSNNKIRKETLEEGVLTTYINERPNSKMRAFIETLLEYRVAAKRISTYGEKFLQQLDVSSRIHTGYTQTFTATGRLSSKAPNLQNIPSPEKGKPHTDIRRFFIARPGYKLITCDMAGAEIAIAADYSQEPLILGALKDGIDMHSELATVSFKIITGDPNFKVSKSVVPVVINGQELIPQELRDTHKSVTFAKFYKGGAKRVYGVLAKYINMYHPEHERMNIAKQCSDALDLRMPKLSKYLDSMIKEAQKKGYLRSDKLGRIRFFPEDVYGEAANYPIQGTNANALKMAMVEIFLYFESCGFDGRIVMNIHDEVVCEVEETYAEEAGKKIKEIMSNSLSYFLKIIKGGAEYKVSNHWQK